MQSSPEVSRYVHQGSSALCLIKMFLFCSIRSVREEEGKEKGREERRGRVRGIMGRVDLHYELLNFDIK